MAITYATILYSPYPTSVEVGARHGPVLWSALAEVLPDEPPLVLAQENVGVAEGAAAEAAGDEGVNPVKRPEVVEPQEPLTRVPEVLPHAVRAAGEGARRVRLAPF